jgi:hypothetical protein
MREATKITPEKKEGGNQVVFSEKNTTESPPASRLKWKKKETGEKKSREKK